MASGTIEAAFNDVAVNGVVVAPGVSGLLALMEDLNIPGVSSEGMETYFTCLLYTSDAADE